MADQCRATLQGGQPCRYTASQELRDGQLPVCGVHGNQARRWLARGDLPSWYLTAEDHGEQQELELAPGVKLGVS